MPQTNGLSPKMILAVTIPAVSTLAGVLILWAVTGALDRLELATAITGVSTSLLAGIAAWAGSPGDVTIPEVGEASDDQLMRSRGVRERMERGLSTVELVGLLCLAGIVVLIVLAV